MFEMSDLLFTARGAANGVAVPVGSLTRCNSMAGASLSFSLSLGRAAYLLGRGFVLPSLALRVGRISAARIPRAVWFSIAPGGDIDAASLRCCACGSVGGGCVGGSGGFGGRRRVSQRSDPPGGGVRAPRILRDAAAGLSRV